MLILECNCEIAYKCLLPTGFYFYTAGENVMIYSIWNKYPCRFIKHNIIIKVKKYIYIRQKIQLTNEKEHIIQLFTKRNTQICNA